jgi:uncharacterized protein (DUF1330 family)
LTLLLDQDGGSVPMTAIPNPGFILVELGIEHAGQVKVLESAATALREGGATVHAWAPAGRVACMEPGTVAAGMLIASMRDPAAIEPLVNGKVLPLLRAQLPAGGPAPKVLKVNGLPANGLPDLPDIPTVASVPRPPQGLRNALMVIQGSASNQTQMDKYRDVILPMMKERGSYYEAFALAEGEVVALSGSWREQIFAISRWPTRASAEDFWYAERYQTTGIPLRIGAGKFTVHVVDEA